MASSYEDFLGDSYDYNSQTFDADKAKQEAEEKKERFRAYPNRVLFQTMTPQAKCSIAS